MADFAAGPASGSPDEGLSGEILHVEHITKEFSGVKVLDDVSFGIRRGEIMGLIGENGAGKSTLIKIISGIYQSTSGILRLNSKPVDIPDYITAKSLGIAIVPQEFNLINTLAVYENIFLGNEIRRPPGLLDKPAMRELAAKQLEELKMPVGVNQLVSKLSVAEKQMVEISKALMLKARFLIMDEPTTTLTGHEVDTLFSLMRDLKAQGVTIIFVSHKLNEIKTICDRVTVLRDGKLISVDTISEVDEEDIARKMIGRTDFRQIFPPKKPKSAEEVLLEGEGITIKGLLHNISFSLRKGEILGFAGLVGAGRTELAEAVMGLRGKHAGTLRIGGKTLQIHSPADAVSHSLGYLSEDRQGKGIVQGFNLPQNITLISLKKYLRGPLIDKPAESAKTAGYVKTFKIAAASQRMRLRYLSGGNQQKVYLSRWLDTDPAILILDEPTRGIDVNAKQEIYEFIHQLAEKGISCIVISSELEEVIGLCSRVYVMKEGMITGCLEGNHINEEEIMFHATGIRGSGVSGGAAISGSKL
ncbi:MAG: sugar ABC transporter ATP-binding protein [Spirochaetaceae bacterium]|jgi:ribose transport system ATP-binding protein|nr:sugar ABC transporter ATP-binding protein [Spirochaetaceae bacterium]